MKTLTVHLNENSYPVYVGHSLLSQVGTLFDLNRRVLIVTDDGVPAGYAKQVEQAASEGTVVTLPQGEGTKTLDSAKLLLQTMMAKGFTRHDCVVAVGGGVVGDLAGFVAATYMRGVDFYNVPTTVLSQVDSSVGGKTGVNLNHIKNIVGAFKQPRAVLADSALLQTLPPRQISAGLAEAVKMAMTFDRELFSLFEEGRYQEHLTEIIARSIAIKSAVVEKDEKETGLRKVLNFGHTLGHGIESLGLGYYHGECVALGMLPMTAPALRPRLLAVLKALSLPTSCDCDKDAVLRAVAHDKKGRGERITAVTVEEVGQFRLRDLTLAELSSLFFEKEL